MDGVEDVLCGVHIRTDHLPTEPSIMYSHNDEMTYFYCFSDLASACVCVFRMGESFWD